MVPIEVDQNLSSAQLTMIFLKSIKKIHEKLYSILLIDIFVKVGKGDYGN